MADTKMDLELADVFTDKTKKCLITLTDKSEALGTLIQLNSLGAGFTHLAKLERVTRKKFPLPDDGIVWFPLSAIQMIQVINKDSL